MEKEEFKEKKESEEQKLHPEDEKFDENMEVTDANVDKWARYLVLIAGKLVRMVKINKGTNEKEIAEMIKEEQDANALYAQIGVQIQKKLRKEDPSVYIKVMIRYELFKMRDPLMFFYYNIALSGPLECKSVTEPVMRIQDTLEDMSKKGYLPYYSKESPGCKAIFKDKDGKLVGQADAMKLGIVKPVNGIPLIENSNDNDKVWFKWNIFGEARIKILSTLSLMLNINKFMDDEITVTFEEWSFFQIFLVEKYKLDIIIPFLIVPYKIDVIACKNLML